VIRWYYTIRPPIATKTSSKNRSSSTSGATPNPHIAFGIGEHFCLGANLASLELEVIFRALLKHVEYVEPTGPLERLRSNFVGGIKRMPVPI
jgi:cholest-4-en-3-one 26-monooxygenase